MRSKAEVRPRLLIDGFTPQTLRGLTSGRPESTGASSPHKGKKCFQRLRPSARGRVSPTGPRKARPDDRLRRNSPLFLDERRITLRYSPRLLRATLRRLRNFNRLADHLALFIRREKCNVRCIAAASDPDDALDRCKPRRIDQPPAIFKVDFEDGVKVGWIEVQRIGAYGAGGNTQRALINVIPRWVKSRHTPARSTNVRSAVVSALLTPDT